MSIPSKIKAGYAIGVDSDGSIFFQVLGEESNVIDLLGLHVCAEKKLELVSASLFVPPAPVDEV